MFEFFQLSKHERQREGGGGRLCYVEGGGLLPTLKHFLCLWDAWWEVGMG